MGSCTRNPDCEENALYIIGGFIVRLKCIELPSRVLAFFRDGPNCEVIGGGGGRVERWKRTVLYIGRVSRTDMYSVALECCSTGFRNRTFQKWWGRDWKFCFACSCTFLQTPSGLQEYLFTSIGILFLAFTPCRNYFKSICLPLSPPSPSLPSLVEWLVPLYVHSRTVYWSFLRKLFSRQRSSDRSRIQ